MQPLIPADVPSAQEQQFIKNYNAITCETDRVFFFACDHKIEHLSRERPEHFFYVAKTARVAMATHLGLIARYGRQHKDVVYIAKLNGKTNFVRPDMADPLSAPCWTVADVVTVAKNSGICLAGIGLTIYLGSIHEENMLSWAAQTIFHAHQQGLVAIVWAYPRGKAVTHETDGNSIAGAVGVAVSLGADVVKIKVPEAGKVSRISAFHDIVASAGNTKVIYGGGEKKDERLLLKELDTYLHEGGVQGISLGRNIFQRPLDQAVALSTVVAQMVYQDVAYEVALSTYHDLVYKKK
ncbi:MAG TPA: aldolase [Candidatus Bathyarchaeia archaeon]|nr:aldolase [Candidatus Bathyarchaeia archaeon]